MVAWDSHNASPPSLLWPPAGKWFSGMEFRDASLFVVAPNGVTVVIVELRGFGTSHPGATARIPTGTTTSSSTSIGSTPSASRRSSFCLPGDVIREDYDEWKRVREANEDPSESQSEVASRSSGRAKYREAIVHIELDGIPRADERGNPPLPSTWIFSTDCVKDDGSVVTWPYDPRNPRGRRSASCGGTVRSRGGFARDGRAAHEPGPDRDEPRPLLRLRECGPLLRPGPGDARRDERHQVDVGRRPWRA